MIRNNTNQSIDCIGIIMDGNRRFAELWNLPIYEGHRKGYDKLTEVVSWARNAKVPHLVVYAFSTENWNRSKKEVGYLMKLFRFILDHEAQKMVEERVRVRFVGERNHFSKDIQEGMIRVEEVTGKDYEITLHIAVSYGGRAEILSATNALIFENSGMVSEEDFSKKLWTKGIPDPDIIIRTGGEKRLSGFLSWQSIYSELFFSDTLWPDFSQKEFETILAEFNLRERRYGE
ncbi:MAG: di-trans,poly-cis-decaprenylcistransferase [Candidatus Yonathbacteria bacterium]|nr:di-trans,poly-cis-decaprenylcistransferase [Candidatus Yonathbacteria bacterium]